MSSENLKKILKMAFLEGKIACSTYVLFYKLKGKG